MEQTFSINEKFKTDLITAILSSPVVYVPHFNYSYVDKALKEIMEEGVLEMTCANVEEYANNKEIDFLTKKKKEGSHSLSSVFEAVIEHREEIEPSIFLAKNCYAEFEKNDFQLNLQLFCSLYEQGKYDKRMTFIMVSPQPMESLPLMVEGLVSVVELPAPTEKEIEEYIRQVLPVSNQFQHQYGELVVELTRTLQGIQHYEIEQIIRSASMRTCNRLTEKTIEYAQEEKKLLVRKSGIIEVIDTDISFDQVGGLNNLRKDLDQKAKLFRHLNELAKMKLPLPKGILIIGMPGCGKSLVAKSIADKFGVSLLRLDISRLMGQYVGQSEANLRKALKVAEAAHPCVLWIDEIEKAFAGANGGGGGHDIVMRMMGHFLTWMQERKTAVYIVATANDVMRPEFMRKGRFDEVYFVDFPKKNERLDILEKKLRLSSEQESVFDVSELTDSVKEKIAENMRGDKSKEEKNGFSGSEIQSVVEAVFEKKYIEYIDLKEKQQDKNAVVAKVKITQKDFDDEIELIRKSVMCNQKGKKDENVVLHKTSAERIRELQSTYNFREA